MLLHMSGCEWKDTRIGNWETPGETNRTTWLEQKPLFEKEALGSVPVLKINGQVFCQQRNLGVKSYLVQYRVQLTDTYLTDMSWKFQKLPLLILKS